MLSVCLRVDQPFLALYWDVVCLYARWSTLPDIILRCCLSLSTLVNPPWHYIIILSVCLRVDPPSLRLYYNFVCLSARWSTHPGTIIKCCLSVCALVYPAWHYIRMLSVCLHVDQPSLSLYWDIVCLSAHWSTLPGTILECCLSVCVLVHPPLHYFGIFLCFCVLVNPRWHYIGMLSVCLRVGPPSLALY